MTRLTLIGVGNMGGAILDGLLAEGWPAGDLGTVSLTTERCRLDDGVGHGSIAEMVAGADIVLVAVKPHTVPEVLAQASAHLRPDAVVVSVAAGVPIATLEEALGTDNPVVRVMPNTPARVGLGVSVVSPGTHATDEHLELVRAVMGAVGIVEVVPESLQDAATGVSGSGPAYVFAMIDALVEAAVQQGLPRPTASRMVAQTFLGASTMAQDAHPVELREQVTSPGGTTARGLRALDRLGLRNALAEAVAAATDRSRELGGAGG